MTQSARIAAEFKAPLYVAWELTHRCNARCLHCYSASGPDASTAGELSTEEGLGVIDQLADAGLLVLAFSGGEPMMRRDWQVLAEHALERGLSLNIASNGSCVTPKTADTLARLGVTSFTVSLDSHEPGLHDHFRQTPGLFVRATRAVRLLAERGLRVVVSFTPTRLNWHHGPQVVALAAELGASAANMSEYVPAGRGSLDLALPPDDLRAVLAQWIGLREEYRGRMDVLWHDCRVGMLVSDEERRRYVGCGAGRLVARILPDGTVTPCVFLPTPIGGFRTTTFREMWASSPLLRQFRERQGHIQGNCGGCEHLDTCGGCRAVAYAYSNGDPCAGDPHCWVTRDARVQLVQLARGEALPV